MSYFISYCKLFICKLKQIDYLVWGKENFFLLLLTCNYAVSVQKGFLFLLVLGIGCAF